MIIAVTPNLTRKQAKPVTLAVCEKLNELEIEYYLPEECRNALPEIESGRFLPADDQIKKCSAVLCIGGDGTVIRAAKTAAVNGKKILGINAGNLAYLCALDPSELDMLSMLKKDNLPVQRRMILECSVFDESGNRVFSDFCVNDIVIGRGTEMVLTDIHITADDKSIADYVGDGAIFSTPTGSTAYSLSAGGPIMEPTLDAVLMTPVCPHSLTVRPYVFNSATVFNITAGKKLGKRQVCFSCDGNTTRRLGRKQRLEIKKAGIYADFLKLKPDNFIDVLNKKIGG